MDSMLESLPSEIIQHIFSFLSPINLSILAATSHHLRSHAFNDLLWEAFVRDNVPPETQLPSYAPAKSWRSLYIAHHPYWFLVKRKLWFSDQRYVGGIVIVRYNHRKGSIEAHRMLARQGDRAWTQWSRDPSVLVHDFSPLICFWINDFVINLELNEGHHENVLQKEIRMATGAEGSITSFLSLCPRIPPHRQYRNMSLWPPMTIPADDRVRNQSPSRFSNAAQRPASLDLASDHTFRLRKSSDMRPSHYLGNAEEVSTWSSLLEESYTPSEQQPWQGIWVGDYSSHQCEFLLVTQKEKRYQQRFAPIRRGSSRSGLPSGIAYIDQDETNQSTSDSTANTDGTGDLDRPNLDANGKPIPSGRLEAIKLTGDPNVPRGECTWFADDIGDAGLIRIADEDIFRGARVVKSMGHVADTGFENDRFIESELIMVDHDTLAQYWMVSTAP